MLDCLDSDARLCLGGREMERNEMTVSDALEKLVMVELDARRRGETDYANGIQEIIERLPELLAE